MNTFIIYYYDNSNLLSFVELLHKKINESKNKKFTLKRCINCNNFFITNLSHKISCSEKCHRDIERKKLLKEKIERNNILFKDKIKNVDYVECPLCGLKSKQLNSAHFVYNHNMTFKFFKEVFIDQLITAPKHIENTLAGQNNPMSKEKRSDVQRKQNSPFSKEFYIYRNIPLEEYYNFINNVKSKKTYNTQLDYYINKGLSYEDACNALKERQRTFSLDKCIEKYGAEGYNIWKNRQDKWKEKVFNEFTLISTGYSKISSEFINAIIANENCENLLYGKNEKFIYDKELKKSYKYDLTNIISKRIIEFNGDFWHMNPKFYKEDDINKSTKISAKDKWESDRLKIETAKKYGYEVLVIWENEYRTNPIEIINKCKNFIL